MKQNILSTLFYLSENSVYKIISSGKHFSFKGSSQLKPKGYQFTVWKFTCVQVYMCKFSCVQVFNQLFYYYFVFINYLTFRVTTLQFFFYL